MKQPNSMLAKRDAAIYAQYRKQLEVMQQIGLDAAMIAANEVLQCGKGRAVPFGQAYMEAVNAIANLIVNDSKDDAEIVYAKEKVDEKICRIVGADNFEPWDVRYTNQNKFRKGTK